MTRFDISRILPWLFLAIPLNVYVIGDWLGTGVQWALFRYQQTYLGSNLIVINTDFQYILDGYITGKTIVSMLFWSMGIIFLVSAIVVSNNLTGKHRIRHTGLLCILSGSAFLLADFIQYGTFLQGPAGICIPIGIPVFFIAGGWLYLMARENDEYHRTINEEIFSLLSSIQNSASTFFENHTPMCLFLVFYFSYNTIFMMNTNGDTVPAAFLPVSIIQYHNLFFDQFGIMAINENTSYAYLFLQNHYYSLFPVVTPVLVTPVYAISLGLSGFFHIPLTVSNILLIAKTCASIITATSGVFVYLAAKEFSTKKIALLATFTYAFATSTWSISSQALWQHGMGALLLILIIYCIIQNEKGHSKFYFTFLGILSGLLFFNRPADAILLIPVFWYIGRSQSKDIVNYAVSGSAAALPFLLYNILIFNNMVGGYNDSIRFFTTDNYEILKNVVGMFIAPNYGMLIFSPILIFSFVGYVLLFKDKRNPVKDLLLLFLPCILVDFLIYSAFGAWRGAIYSFGPRYVTGILPILILYMVVFFNYHFRKCENNLKKTGVTILVFLFLFSSVLIQFIGVFYYAYLPDKGMNDSRAWDLNDMIIVESVNAGFGKKITITMHTFQPLRPVLKYRFGS